MILTNTYTMDTASDPCTESLIDGAETEAMDIDSQEERDLLGDSPKLVEKNDDPIDNPSPDNFKKKKFIPKNRITPPSPERKSILPCPPPPPTKHPRDKDNKHGERKERKKLVDNYDFYAPEIFNEEPNLKIKSKVVVPRTNHKRYDSGYKSESEDRSGQQEVDTQWFTAVHEVRPIIDEEQRYYKHIPSPPRRRPNEGARRKDTNKERKSYLPPRSSPYTMPPKPTDKQTLKGYDTIKIQPSRDPSLASVERNIRTLEEAVNKFTKTTAENLAIVEQNAARKVEGLRSEMNSKMAEIYRKFNEYYLEIRGADVPELKKGDPAAGKVFADCIKKKWNINISVDDMAEAFPQGPFIVAKFKSIAPGSAYHKILHRGPGNWKGDEKVDVSLDRKKTAAERSMISSLAWMRRKDEKKENPRVFSIRFLAGGVFFRKNKDADLIKVQNMGQVEALIKPEEKDEYREFKKKGKKGEKK